MNALVDGIVRADSLTIEQGLGSFLIRCQAKNLSGETLLWYKKRLAKFNAFLASKGVMLLREITPDLLRLHLEDLKAHGGIVGKGDEEREVPTATGTIFRTFGAIRCMAESSLCHHPLGVRCSAVWRSCFTKFAGFWIGSKPPTVRRPDLLRFPSWRPESCPGSPLRKP